MVKNTPFRDATSHVLGGSNFSHEDLSHVTWDENSRSMIIPPTNSRSTIISSHHFTNQNYQQVQIFLHTVKFLNIYFNCCANMQMSIKWHRAKSPTLSNALVGDLQLWQLWRMATLPFISCLCNKIIRPHKNRVKSSDNVTKSYISWTSFY